jgi:hypothetical protein
MGSFIRTVTLLFAMLTLTSCIGKNNSKNASSPGTSNKSRVNLAKFSILSTSFSTFFNFTGSDSTGSKYVGTSQSFVDGPTIFDNISTIKKTNTLTITKVGLSPTTSPYFYGYTAPVTYSLSYISTYYYNLNKTIYKVIFSNGLTATPANQFSYPSTVTFQNLTTGTALTYSNGSSLSSTWNVIADGGNKKLQINWSTNALLSQIDSYILDPSEVILNFSSTLVDFPTPGTTTTLTSF